MRKLAWLFVFLAAIPSAAQSYPEVEALLDVIFAKDPATVLRHLPVAIEKQLAGLPLNDQFAFAHELMFADRLAQEGITVSRSDDGRSLVHVAEKASDHVADLTLEKRLSDGYECLLRFAFTTTEDHGVSRYHIQIWMRFEEGEWRIVEFEPTDSGSDIMNFEDPQTVARFCNRHMPAADAAALVVVRTYNSSFVTYAAYYPEVGYPPSLEVLGSANAPQEPDAQHNSLVEPLLAARQPEKNGYRFEYRPDPSQYPRQSYVLIARPVAYGATGRRSFYADQSGSVHFTEEDREPTPDDPLIP